MLHPVVTAQAKTRNGSVPNDHKNDKLFGVNKSNILLKLAESKQVCWTLYNLYAWQKPGMPKVVWHYVFVCFLILNSTGKGRMCTYYTYVTTAQRDITPEDTITFFGFLFHSFYMAVHLTAPVYKFLVTGEVNTPPPPPPLFLLLPKFVFNNPIQQSLLLFLSVSLKKRSIYYTNFWHTFSATGNSYPSPTRFGKFQRTIFRD